MNSEDNIVLIKDKVKELVRHAAQDRARVHTRQNEFMLTEVPEGYKVGQILGNWMSLILLTGEHIKITIKLHFSNKDIKDIVFPIYGEPSAETISDQQAMDFVKELSNLTAGYLVQLFEEAGISLSISLPLGTRGFYEIFADYAPSSHPLLKYSDIWCLGQGETKIFGSVMVEISDVKALASLQTHEIAKADEDDEGEFDFL